MSAKTVNFLVFFMGDDILLFFAEKIVIDLRIKIFFVLRFGGSDQCQVFVGADDAGGAVQQSVSCGFQQFYAIFFHMMTSLFLIIV